MEEMIWMIKNCSWSMYRLKFRVQSRYQVIDYERFVAEAVMEQVFEDVGYYE